MCRATAYFLILFVCARGFAQQIFYDAKRDKQAQDAASAAKDVTSNSVFDAMLRNADQQTQVELKTSADWQGVVGPNAFDTLELWNDPNDSIAKLDSKSLDGVSPCVQKSVFAAINPLTCTSLRCRIESLRNQLNINDAADLDQVAIEDRLKRIQTIVTNLNTQIKSLQDSEAAQKNRFLQPLLDQLETGQKLLKYAENIKDKAGTGKAQALGEIESALTEIQKWAGIIQGIWVGYQAILQSPRNLLPLHEQLDLDLVLIEQQRLKEQGLIYARLYLDIGDVLEKLNEAQRLLCGRDPLDRCPLLTSKSRIEDTLQDLANKPAAQPDKDPLLNALNGLYEAASAFTQGGIGVQLCSLREGVANRAAGIRKAAVSAKATEKAAQEATQRLALYYKSGIKPSELATLLFSLAGGIASPIAAIQ